MYIYTDTYIVLENGLVMSGSFCIGSDVDIS